MDWAPPEARASGPGILASVRAHMATIPDFKDQRVTTYAISMAAKDVVLSGAVADDWPINYATLVGLTTQLLLQRLTPEPPRVPLIQLPVPDDDYAAMNAARRVRCESPHADDLSIEPNDVADLADAPMSPRPSAATITPAHIRQNIDAFSAAGLSAFLRAQDDATAELWSALGADLVNKRLPRLENAELFLSEFDVTAPANPADAQRRLEQLAVPQLVELCRRFKAGLVTFEHFVAQLLLHKSATERLSHAPECLRGTCREVWDRRKVPGYRSQDGENGFFGPGERRPEDFVDAEWAAAQFGLQTGRCACCEQPMSLWQYVPHNARQATADRLDEDKPHVCSNCVLSHATCNSLRMAKRLVEAVGHAASRGTPMPDNDVPVAAPEARPLCALGEKRHWTLASKECSATKAGDAPTQPPAKRPRLLTVDADRLMEMMKAAIVNTTVTSG